MPVNIDRNLGKKMGKLEFTAQRVVEGFITGVHKSPYHGFSLEFTEYKPYNQGDSVRNIDWKLYGKTEKMYVKHYEEETNLRCQFLLDMSSSMNFPQKEKDNKLQYAVNIVACLTYIFSKQRDAVGLTVFDETINTFLPPKTSQSHIAQMYQLLEEKCINLSPDKGTAIDLSLTQMAMRLPKRSVVVILSDMITNKENALESLKQFKYKKHEVILCFVYDSLLEMNFEYPDNPYEFVDIETKASVKLYPYQVKESFVSEAKRKKKELLTICNKYGVSFLEIDIRKDLTLNLQAFLNQRKKHRKKWK